MHLKNLTAKSQGLKITIAQIAPGRSVVIKKVNFSKYNQPLRKNSGKPVKTPFICVDLRLNYRISQMRILQNRTGAFSSIWQDQRSIA